MRVLITGASGFTGTCMMEFLSHQAGIEPAGLFRNNQKKKDLFGGSSIVADLLDRNTLFTGVAKVCPDAIIHLGGLTRGSPGDLLLANVVGTKNILDAGYAASPDCRMLVVSSSAVYGYQGTQPIREENPFLPVTDYGASKAAQDILTAMHHRTMRSLVTIARPFNLIGPGQDEHFLCGKIVRQIAEFEQGSQDTLNLFETGSCRDYIDVRDAVTAYMALISHPHFDLECAGKTFNIGSGRAYPVSEVIATLEQITGRQYPVQLPDAPQKISIPSQQSDNSRIFSATGWRPEIPLFDSLRDMLDVARGFARTR